MSIQKNKYIELLKEMGLSEHESAVYFTMVHLGPSTILRIARASEIKRTTIYYVIDSLKEKGLARVEIEGFKKLYTAESPIKIKSLIESRSIRFNESLGDLLAYYNKSESDGNTAIKIYEGLEATKSVYNKILSEIKNGEDYLVIAGMKKAFDMDKDFFKDLQERRARLPINVRILMADPNNEESQRLKKYEQNFNVKARFLPANTVLTTNTVITPQRILIHQMEPPIMAIVIENQSTIKTHREFFEIMWNSAKD